MVGSLAPLLSITTPLGPDVLFPVSFALEEALSQPFIGVVDLVSERKTIDPFKLLHQPVCVSISLSSGQKRTVNAVVRHFASTGAVAEREAFGYRAEIVPAIWFLSQTGDCRIFEKKTTKDIVQQVLKDHGVPVSFMTAGLQPRPFTMQYNESDLDFISRLLQEEGWFYFFADKEYSGPRQERIPAGCLVVSDRATSMGKPDPLRVRPGYGQDADVLANWQPGRGTAPRHVTQDVYDPEHPSSDLRSTIPGSEPAPGPSGRVVYHWPALGSTREEIDRRTRRLIEAAEVEAVAAHGAGFDPRFTCGSRINVHEGGQSTDFTVRSVSHQVIDDTWRNGSSPPSYANSFVAVPAKTPWRPVRTIRRPRMDGVYSATVMGPQGQEIHTDELGRVKVRFRWDHRIDATASDGVWVRVMQPWAGPNAGWSFIPRVGTEIVVSFMDGDPDRPVVIGQLHNASEKPPWALPDNKTRSGLRTRSTPEGGSQDFSELWFDDRKGEEQVMLHAQRDLTIEAENDATHDIGQDRKVTVQKGDDSLTVVKGNRVVDVTKGNHTIRSTSGDIVIKTAAGSVSVEAMQSLTLKVGQSSVTLDPSGVVIKGLMVKIEGQTMTSLKGPILQLDADGMLKAAGGIMMLN